MKEKKRLVSLCFTLALLLTASNTFAHNLWLNPENHFPRVGETVEIGIGWGHTYRANRMDQEVKEDRVEEITALDPDGKTVEPVKESAALYKLKVEKPGVYLVTARIRPGVFTMTPEGRKWATKKEVENPIKCTAFHISAKTIIVAGAGSGNLSGLVHQPVEVIPLEDPGKLKKGGSLPVKVLFEGSPLAEASVRAVYAGFGDDVEGDGHGANPAEKSGAAKEGSADKSHKEGGAQFPFETITDGSGLATVKLERAGYWMISLSHKVPYPDTETCDESMYNSVFTFQVK